eukprot:TRINITY_DN3118_c0_g2_i1.p1 TRINITY_DN3118_c0_g2~~TRINITY_DN3118_c0_g2_i1.p1  ORF type:complete len:757 (+),score=165.00 TRINITY_DN3118_c0_g2_i1:3834-6104(+)
MLGRSLVRQCVPVRVSSGELTQYAESVQYVRNTTLRKPITGYKKRWKHYAGYLEARAKLPWELNDGLQSRASWFAVPHIGRHLPGTPLYHVVTVNHMIHPFWYPDLYSQQTGSPTEFLKYRGEHDVASTLYTATPTGHPSHHSLKTVPDLTYAHETRHLDVCVLHPSVADTEETLEQVFTHQIEEPVLGVREFDYSEYEEEKLHPFHFQLLAFDNRPLQVGERVMVHGHSADDTLELTAVMHPSVTRCTVKKVVTDINGSSDKLIVIEPEKPLPEGACGGPVLRDGRVVGMVTATVDEHAEHSGCVVVVGATTIREFLLRIEEKWRWPQHPSSNYLRGKGLLSGETVKLPVWHSGTTNEVIPKRYIAPDFLPSPTTTSRAREYIDIKFNVPLPVDYSPPQLPHPDAPRVPVSRDRTNPYGELPADSGLNIPSLPLFSGYNKDDDSEENTPGWILKYGSAEGYWKAHGLEPPVDGVKGFKNYISPRVLPGRGWGLLEDRTEAGAEYLIGAPDETSEPVERKAEMTVSEMDSMGMDNFFGEEEYVVQRDLRRKNYLMLLEEELKKAVSAEEVKMIEEKRDEFILKEDELDWHRGDKKYVSEERKLLGEREEEVMMVTGGDSRENALTADAVTEVKTMEMSIEQRIRNAVQEVKDSSCGHQGADDYEQPSLEDDSTFVAFAAGKQRNITSQQQLSRDIHWGPASYPVEEPSSSDTPEATWEEASEDPLAMTPSEAAVELPAATSQQDTYITEQAAPPAV